MLRAVLDLEIYLNTIKADKYRVNLIPSNGRTGHSKPWDRNADEILEDRPGYFKGNSIGMREVYCRAYDKLYILADDISTKDIHKVYKYNPTLVVETSKDNHQVWFRCDMIENEQQQLSAAKWLVSHVGSDPGAVSSMQLGRLPSFYNRKPGRQKFLVRVVRDPKNYVPGQYSTLPIEAYSFKRVSSSNTRATHSKRRRLSQAASGASAPSSSPMSQSRRDNSSWDWQYCMKALEESFGRIPKDQLERDLADATRKQKRSSKLTDNYVRNTVQRAIEKYRENNVFWQAGM